MTKKKFYSLCRYVDKTDGNIKAGYLLKEGFDVPNDLGFDLAVYRGSNNSVMPNPRNPKVWYVVDTRSGLSISEGDTKSKAIQSALKRLETVDMEVYKKKCCETEEIYGPYPGHDVMPNLCGLGGN